MLQLSSPDPQLLPIKSLLRYSWYHEVSLHLFKIFRENGFYFASVCTCTQKINGELFTETLHSCLLLERDHQGSKAVLEHRKFTPLSPKH